jgi:hypothetical protein
VRLKSGLKRVIPRLAASVGNRRDISDFYVNELCAINPGWLHRGNLYCFDFAIRNLPSPSPIVEIGSFCGLSTNLITYYKERNGVRNPLITCDRWAYGTASDRIGSSSVSYADYSTFARETFIRSVRTFSRGDLPYPLEMFSAELFDAWRKSEAVTDLFGRPVQLGGPISFCYIDGNHSYESARRDFEECDAFLERGGFILFDDSGEGSDWGVCRVVDEVKACGRYELVTRNPNYLFRKR